MIQYRQNPVLSRGTLNDLFAASWSDHEERDFDKVLQRSLVYFGAFAKDRLIGFVNMAWDGGHHAFVLDTTVHPEFRRQGIGTRLVAEAVAVARCSGITWVHVDCEPPLENFYFDSCGFRTTSAGLLRLE